MENIKLFDCHSHTEFSPDSSESPENLVKEAINKRLGGVSITDHYNGSKVYERDEFTPIKNSVKTANALKEKYSGRIKVLSGVEVGEYGFSPEITEKLLKENSFDVVLGSVHRVQYDKYDRAYWTIDFPSMPSEDMYEFLGLYFDNMIYICENQEFDILAHLTSPLRYIVAKYNLPCDLTPFAGKIDTILKMIIKNNQALEINTSNFKYQPESYSPDMNIVGRYYELGGRMITFGSDAHKKEELARGFDLLTKRVKAIGFEKACYFEKRKPQFYDL